MRSFLKSAFLWQFAGGFLLGAVGMVTLHPIAGFTGSALTAQHAGR